MSAEDTPDSASAAPAEAPQETREGTAQRVRVVKLIAGCALAVSVLYVALYGYFGFWKLSVFVGIFGVFYAVILAWNNPAQMRLCGIVLIGCGTVHVAGLGALFVPPEAGTHTFLMLIPIFSLIAIHPKDRFWWWTYTVFSVGLVVYFEWESDTLIPPFAVPLAPGDYGPWRAVAALLTLILIIGVFRGFHRDLYVARKELRIAYDRSESLLLSILPASIAQRLKADQGTIADDFDEASVLFADLVGFTSLASRQSASETVAMLNTIFSAFDEAVEDLDLEKIKTIGDAYMVAAGLPTPRPDHVAQLVRLAFRMIAVVDDYNVSHGHTFELRVGVSCGPLTAGVIGSRKFSYDIWGDTVNVASRMESTGLPGRVQVTEAVAKAAAQHFEFEDRGLVKVKGKGEMRTFLVSPPSSDRA